MDFSIVARAQAQQRLADLGGQLQRQVYIETMGCQMNVYDSERMAEVLRADGYVRTEDVQLADLVLINTCSIRDRVEHKVSSMLGVLKKLKEFNPDLVLGVTGCVAQQQGEQLLAKVPHLDLVLGPDRIAQLPELVRKAREEQHRSSAVAFMPRKAYTFPEVSAPEDGRVSSFVTIMKGCNKVCSFCIVPFTRGREVSKPSADVLAELKVLADAGVREVTLLGQNVNSYGKDCVDRDGNKGELDFAELLAAVSELPGIERIRFTTSHPMDCTDGLIDAFGQLAKLMPFFHLPIQSGSVAVLRAMRRHHGVDDYLEKIERLRMVRPDLALSTDIIVGFPGETERDFQDTLELLQKVKYASIYSFVYSARPGTKAAELVDDVSLDEKRRRIQAVQTVQDQISQDWMRAQVGTVQPVLFEGPSRLHDLGPNSLLAGRQEEMPQLVGRTPHNAKVHVPMRKIDDLVTLKGQIRAVHLDHAHAHSLSGTVVETVP